MVSAWLRAGAGWHPLAAQTGSVLARNGMGNLRFSVSHSHSLVPTRLDFLFRSSKCVSSRKVHGSENHFGSANAIILLLAGVRERRFL
jgi:hypothetical protein